MRRQRHTLPRHSQTAIETLSDRPALPIAIGFGLLLFYVGHSANCLVHTLRSLPSYCNSVGSSFLQLFGRNDDGGGYLVFGSRLSRRTPWVARPAARMVLVSMRMILPNWLMTISSLVSSTS